MDRIRRPSSGSCLIERVDVNLDGSLITLALGWTNYMLVETKWLLSDVHSTYNVCWQLQVLLGMQEDTFKLVLYFPAKSTFNLDTRFELQLYEDKAKPLYSSVVQHTGFVHDFFTVADIPLVPIKALLQRRNNMTKIYFQLHFTHLFQFSSTALHTPANLGFLFNHRETSDCQFEIEREVFYAHKLLLSNQSPFFKAMFESGFTESHQNTIYFKEWSSVSFLGCLLHMYLGWLPCDTIPDKFVSSIPLLQLGSYPPNEISHWIDMGSLARMLGLNRFSYYAFQHAHEMLSKEVLDSKKLLMEMAAEQ